MEQIFDENSELAVLNEVYFGKVGGLLKLEEMFTKLRQEYSNTDPLNRSVYNSIIKNPIFKKISKEIETLFGYKEVLFTLSHSKYVSAATMPYLVDENGDMHSLAKNDLPYDKLSGSVIVTNSGFTFNKKKISIKIIITFTVRTLFINELSIPEIISILLHEIGHSFAFVIKNIDSSKRVDEKFADQFVAMYGYGHELTSFFAKVTKSLYYKNSSFDNFFKDVPILNVLTGINKIRKNLSKYYRYLDSHPTYILRMKSIISQLEADLKDTPNLSVTMRRDIEKQIEICKKAISDTFSPSKDANMAERMIKYYYREMEPGLRTEQRQQAKAEIYTAPTTVNKKIKTMLHKKGWFK